MPERRTVQFKAWNARPLNDILSPRHWHFPMLRNSTAIAKFHNMGIGQFGHNAFIHELIRGSLAMKISSENDGNETTAPLINSFECVYLQRSYAI
jgi:hypothetical protein